MEPKIADTWFSQYFNTVKVRALRSLERTFDDNEANSFYSPTLLDTIIKDYLVLHPLRINCIYPDIFKEEADNSILEHWFLDVKKLLLDWKFNLKLLKVGSSYTYYRCILERIQELEASIVKSIRLEAQKLLTRKTTHKKLLTLSYVPQRRLTLQTTPHFNCVRMD